MSRRRKRLPTELITLRIDSLSAEGRGLARLDGKTVFVEGALPEELVYCRYIKTHRRFDEAIVVDVIEKVKERVVPECPHFMQCGGCVLQHMNADDQIALKQQALIDNLQHIGNLSPKIVLDPLTDEVWGYRRKARLGVKYVPKKGKVLVGFREKQSKYLADLSECHVLDPVIGKRIDSLAGMVQQLELFDKIPQVEVAIGDEVAALVFRVLESPGSGDIDLMTRWGEENGFSLYLQTGGPDSVELIFPQQSELYYSLDEYGVKVYFQPLDFTQVNSGINRKMIAQTIKLLELSKNDNVLEFFSGLGNFTLPMATLVKHVTSVEGEESLVKRARQNAEKNGLKNIDYYSADLSMDVSQSVWAKAQHYNKVLLDPPRSGAAELMPFLSKTVPETIVYVSCNPATLSRDADILVHDHGYKLEAAGAMDMFPHTGHVESIAKFVHK